MIQRKRMKTFMEILHYLGAPVFDSMYDAYYDVESDELVIQADNPVHIKLLCFYADVLGSAIPQDVLKSCDVSENCILYIQGRAIERFADSLLEILMHHLFKTQSDCA
jgi:hypothetical protein